jgi:DNA-binding HxlR family transcriptional regulator
MNSESSVSTFDGSSVQTDTPLFARPDEVFDAVQDKLGRKWHLRIVYHLLEAGWGSAPSKTR